MKTGAVCHSQKKSLAYKVCGILLQIYNGKNRWNMQSDSGLYDAEVAKIHPGVQKSVLSREVCSFFVKMYSLTDICL